ncbi:hypothetical protein ACF0H5_002035 [Mactra antiquata]
MSSSQAYLRRASINEAQLASELKSWGKNKAMDRKLEKKNETEFKHLAHRRKTYQYEQELLSKNFEKKVMKTTLPTEEYLERSMAKYVQMRERERERLDRKFEAISRRNIQEFNQLTKNNERIFNADRKRRPSDPDTKKEDDELKSKPKPKEIPPKTQKEVGFKEDESKESKEKKEPLEPKDREESKEPEEQDEPKDTEEPKLETVKEDEEESSSEEDDVVSDLNIKTSLKFQNRRATITTISKNDRPVVSNAKGRRASFAIVP